MTVQSALISTNGNVLVAVDVETTGRTSGWHEVCQVAVVPLNSELEPSQDLRPFYLNIAPEHPERAERSAFKVNGLDLDDLMVNGIDPWRAADLFDEWVKGLDLPFTKRLVPLAHNWAFERGFLLHWLGQETYDQFWQAHPRDTMIFGAMLNDAAAFYGRKIPFGILSLTSMCRKFGIENDNQHDALSDALCGAKLYRELMLGFGR